MTIQRKMHAVTLAGLLEFSGLALAADQPAQCPAELAQASVRLIEMPDGWTPYIASPIYLHSAGMASGPPGAFANLRGEATVHKNKNEWSKTFKLDGEHPYGNWIECGYGEYNQIKLSRRIDDRAKECTMTYRTGEH